MVANEVTRRRFPAPHVFGAEEDHAAEAEIEAVYRQKLAGLRRLPPLERPHALRMARQERMLARKALRERRAYARHGKRLLRRLRTPAPR